MTSKAALRETDLGRFFRAFHDVYPTTLSKKRKKEIWAIAKQLFDGTITVEQALTAAGIPVETHQSDVKAADASVIAFFMMLLAFAFFVAYALAASGTTPPKPGRNPHPDQRAKEQAFSLLFQALEADEEPEEWIDVIGDPVPVLGPKPSKEEAPSASRSRNPRPRQSEISGASKSKRPARAKLAKRR